LFTFSESSLHGVVVIACPCLHALVDTVSLNRFSENHWIVKVHYPLAIFFVRILHCASACIWTRSIIWCCGLLGYLSMRLVSWQCVL